MNFRYFILLVFLLSPVLASAEEKEAVRSACKADVKANCGTVFSRSKAIGCLVDNAAKLSDGCTAALKVASCNAKAPTDLKAAFPCTQ